MATQIHLSFTFKLAPTKNFKQINSLFSFTITESKSINFSTNNCSPLLKFFLIVVALSMKHLLTFSWYASTWCNPNEGRFDKSLDHPDVDNGLATSFFKISGTTFNFPIFLTNGTPIPYFDTFLFLYLRSKVGSTS